VEDP